MTPPDLLSLLHCWIGQASYRSPPRTIPHSPQSFDCLWLQIRHYTPVQNTHQASEQRLRSHSTVPAKCYLLWCSHLLRVFLWQLFHGKYPVSVNQFKMSFGLVDCYMNQYRWRLLRFDLLFRPTENHQSTQSIDQCLYSHQFRLKWQVHWGHRQVKCSHMLFRQGCTPHSRKVKCLSRVSRPRCTRMKAWLLEGSIGLGIESRQLIVGPNQSDHR